MPQSGILNIETATHSPSVKQRNSGQRGMYTRLIHDQRSLGPWDRRMLQIDPDVSAWRPSFSMQGPDRCNEGSVSI